MIKKIVLIGAGGFGREVANIINNINRKNERYDLLGFLDDGAQFGKNSVINGLPWLGDSNWILSHKEEVKCVCTVGNAKIKCQLQEGLMKQGVHFETIIANGVRIADNAEIGDGSVIYPNVGISVDCKIGYGVLLNGGVTIGHDAIVGDYTVIMPGTGISGGCNIGKGVNIGGHAFIIPGRKIGDNATIAAGSIVFSNVKGGTTVLGNPAKRMKELE